MRHFGEPKCMRNIRNIPCANANSFMSVSKKTKGMLTTEPAEVDY